MPDHGLSMTLETKQVMTQARIQSLEILALNSCDLESFLQNEYLDNPMIEYTTPEPTEQMKEFAEQYDQTYRPGESGSVNSEDREHNAAVPAARDADYLKRYILEQLDLPHMSREKIDLVRFLTDSLEDNGRLTLSVSEIEKLTPCTKEEIRETLKMLKGLEPAGIFAADLAECLLLQLKSMRISDPILEKLIKSHLEAISKGQIRKIAKEMKLSEKQIDAYIDMIKSLDPNPLSFLSKSEAEYIIPDMIVARQGDDWAVIISDNRCRGYHINDYYLHMMRETKDPSLFEYFKKKLERSRLILSCIEQRRKTLEAIGAYILEKQKPYFAGKTGLAPMTMSEAAQQIGISVSTVSRAIKGKYVQSPRGLSAFRDLFSSAAAGAGTEDAVSAGQVKEAIRAAIEAEDKKKPLSDDKLIKVLAKDGMGLSRRTIAKYREEMGIPNSFSRKRS